MTHFPEGATVSPELSQVFSWTDPADPNRRLVFLVGNMLLDLRVSLCSTTELIHLDGDFAEFAREHRGLDVSRLSEWLAMLSVLGHPSRLHPEHTLLMLDMGDGSHLLVDGHHRYVAAYHAGWREYPAFLVPAFVWTKHYLRYEELSPSLRKKMFPTEEA